MPRNHAHLVRPVPGGLPPVMRVHGPAALVQAVPYLIGFHPARSLVLVGLHDGRLVVTARLDLELGNGDDDLAHALRVLLNGGVTEVVALVYDGDADDGWMPRTLVRLGDLAEQGGAGILDVLLVNSGRWRSMCCDDDACCPPEGRPIDEQTSEFAAAATFAGVVPHADRDALSAILEPAAPASRATLAPLIAAAADLRAGGSTGPPGRTERAVKRALFAAARASDARGQCAELTPADLARFAVGLAILAVRDSLWMAVDAGRLDGRPLWADLARRLPCPYDAAPSFLFGWRSWRSGNGALAGIAARRAIESDPGYSAADLLLAAVNGGVDPRRLPTLRPPRPPRR